MVQRAENCSGPAVVARSLEAGVPVVQVVLDSVLRQSRGHSRCATEKSSTSNRAGYDGDEWFFGAFCAIFRAPPVIPELSASFSSPRR